MVSALIIIFVIAYAAIALEHSIKINKSASALLSAGLLWTVYALGTNDHYIVEHQLSESLATTAQVVFFLIGAMESRSSNRISIFASFKSAAKHAKNDVSISRYSRICFLGALFPGFKKISLIFLNIISIS